MRVLIVGSTGCIGSAVAQALRMRGHTVIGAARSLRDGERSIHVDYMQPRSPEVWAERLRDARIDAVVNAVGILIPSRTQRFERVHAQGPIELFRGAVLAGATRIVQVSALGVGDDAVDVPYLATKLAADDALQALAAQRGIDHAVVRPSLVHGPGSASGSLFATLASLPVISLPGRGDQPVQPVHVYEVAEAITRLLEMPGPVAGVFDLAGPRAVSYQEMLAAYRRALGLGDAWWLRVPMAVMTLGAYVAETLPQKVFARDTLRLLARGNVSQANAAPALLGRAPTGLDEGLRVTPPHPMFDLRVDLGPAASAMLRAAVAFMWLYTALVTALLPDESGVLRLLARCGFDGTTGVVVMVASCLLNTALGVAMLRRPGARAYAAQTLAVLGYTATAAFNMPELTIDHCGPLVKNVPLLALLFVLWSARTPRPGTTAVAARVTQRQARNDRRARLDGTAPRGPRAATHEPSAQAAST